MAIQGMSTDLRHRRNLTGWSIRALAAHMDVTEHAIKSAESGRNRSPTLIRRLEDALEFAATNPPPRPKCGFASMPAEEQRRIASMGGRAVHAFGVGRRFTADEARAAGLKGACRDRSRMAEIGALGGAARRKAAASARGGGLGHRGPHAVAGPTPRRLSREEQAAPQGLPESDRGRVR